MGLNAPSDVSLVTSSSQLSFSIIKQNSSFSNANITREYEWGLRSYLN